MGQENNGRKTVISALLGVIIKWCPLIVAVAGLIISTYFQSSSLQEVKNDRIHSDQQLQRANANRVFVQTVISEDIYATDAGVIGGKITSTLFNSSANPVFKVVLVIPKPKDGVDLKVSPRSSRKVLVSDSGYSLVYSTPLAPGEHIEYSDVYDTERLFSTVDPDFVLGKSFRFCFTDVEGQKWLADHEGSHKIKGDTPCDYGQILDDKY